jgi:hypothetical protein
MLLASIPRGARRSALLFATFTVLVTMSALCPAQPFPSKGTYDFYVNGRYVEGNALVIRSKTSTNLNGSVADIQSKTVVSKDSLRIISYSYTGTRGDNLNVSLSAVVKGDSIVGFTASQGNRFPGQRLIDPKLTALFENYVAEHEILLARAYLLSGEETYGCYIFYPSDFLLVPATIAHESTAELETERGSVLCTKISVNMTNAAPFFSYIDNAAKIPIYMDFPGVATEIFSHDYYGDDVRPKYIRKE